MSESEKSFRRNIRFTYLNHSTLSKWQALKHLLLCENLLFIVFILSFYDLKSYPKPTFHIEVAVLDTCQQGSMQTALAQSTLYNTSAIWSLYHFHSSNNLRFASYMNHMFTYLLFIITVSAQACLRKSILFFCSSVVKRINRPFQLRT